MNDGYGDNMGPAGQAGYGTRPSPLPGVPPAKIDWVPIAPTTALFGIGSVVALSAVLHGAWGLLAWAATVQDGKLLGGMRTGLAYLLQSTNPNLGLADSLFALICLLLLLIGLASIGRSVVGVFNPTEFSRLRMRVVVLVWLFLAAYLLTKLTETSAAVFLYAEGVRLNFIAQLFLFISFTSAFLFMASRDAPNQLCSITIYGRNELYQAECLVQLSIQAHLAESPAMQNFLGKLQNYGGGICSKLNEISSKALVVLARSMRGGSQLERGWDSAIDTKRFAELKETLVSSFDGVSHDLRNWLTKVIDADLMAQFHRPGLVICDVQSIVVELASEMREEYRNVQQIKAKQAEGGIQLEGETVKAALMNQKMRASDDDLLFAFQGGGEPQTISNRPEDRRMKIEMDRLIERIAAEVGFDNNVINDNSTRWRLEKVLGKQSDRFIELLIKRGGTLTHATVETVLREMLNQAKLGN